MNVVSPDLNARPLTMHVGFKREGRDGTRRENAKAMILLALHPRYPPHLQYVTPQLPNNDFQKP